MSNTRGPRVQPQVVDLFAPQPDAANTVTDEVIDDVIDDVTDEGVDEVTTDEPAATRPAAPDELTPEQVRIRDLENLLALERGRKDPEEELEAPAEPAGNSENIRIHILTDGFTFSGKVWYRGQEVEFTPGTPAYRDTCDRRGWSWLELRDNDFAQVQRYGDIMFRSGPWPGKNYTDAATMPYEALKAFNGRTPTPPTEGELAAAQKAETDRRRAAPRLPTR